MQKSKEHIKREILKVARKEFIKKGFKDTSMRTIAKNSKVGLSNLYNYFKNKDEIFQEILAALLKSLDEVMMAHNSPDNIATYVDNTKEYGREQFLLFLNLIANHKEDFKLLFFKSAGSSLENYREICTEKFTLQGKEYIDLVKLKYPSCNNDISIFFIHTMSSWTMNCIAELVKHDLSGEEIEAFLMDYMTYSTAGWKELMNL